MVNIGMLSFIFFNDTTNWVEKTHSDATTNHIYINYDIGSLMYFVNSILVFIIFVQNMYEFKQVFEYCSEKEKQNEPLTEG